MKLGFGVCRGSLREGVGGCLDEIGVVAGEGGAEEVDEAVVVALVDDEGAGRVVGLL